MLVPRSQATFGSVLREHRLAAGLTQDALSERSGVSLRTIQEVEADHARPRRSTVVSLAEALTLPDAARDELLRMAAPRPRRRHAEPSGDAADGRQPPDSALAPAPIAETIGAEPTLVSLHRSTPTNVPWPVSSLLGRETELAVIRDLIGTDRQRLVTLTGVSGSGKTRLAIEVATELLDQFVDGVWFVDLAPTSSPALVPRSVAGALGVREVQDAPILDALLGFLRRKRLLLVLDNCEHLVNACAELADRLLTACPDLHVLATSREPLRIDGERRWPVQPLAVPDLDGRPTFDALAGTAAVRLFVGRARAIDPGFALTEANAASVAQVCARLDGIPLAIELAASRLGVLEVEQVAARLDDAFRLLAGGTRGGPTRQQTMEAALAWSYDLLTPAEQATFRALSVFAGGFDLEAAEAVCDPEPTGDQPASPLDILGRLVDKSLVTREQSPPGRRYRLLEPVRQYAWQLLTATGEEARARTRHASYYAALAERAAPLLRGPAQQQWLDRLEADRDNLRETIAWIVKRADVDDGLRLAVALTPYWEARGYLSEGRRWLETVLTASNGSGSWRAVRMRALIAAGALAQWQGDLAGAETLLTEALTTARVLGDLHSEAETLGWLSSATRQQDAAERGLLLGEESLRLAQALADQPLIAFALLNAGVALRNIGDTGRSVTVLDECVLRYRQLGDARYAAIASTMLGWAVLEAGEHDRAAVVLRESVLALRAVGDQGFIVYGLRGLAHVSHAQGEPRRAAQVFGASQALRTALGMRETPLTTANDLNLRTALERQLAPSEFTRAYAEGEAMSLDQVLAEIDATLDAPGRRG